jgi:hypothetical protein
MQAAELDRVRCRITELDQQVVNTISMLENEQTILKNAGSAWGAAVARYNTLPQQEQIKAQKWLASKEGELDQMRRNIEIKKRRIQKIYDEIDQLRQILESHSLCSSCAVSGDR